MAVSFKGELKEESSVQFSLKQKQEKHFLYVCVSFNMSICCSYWDIDCYNVTSEFDSTSVPTPAEIAAMHNKCSYQMVEFCNISQHHVKPVAFEDNNNLYS